ncbi:MAG: hypothetical protein ACFB16_16240 [Phormidesmis sp.]
MLRTLLEAALCREQSSSASQYPDALGYRRQLDIQYFYGTPIDHGLNRIICEQTLDALCSPGMLFGADSFHQDAQKNCDRIGIRRQFTNATTPNLAA